MADEDESSDEVVNIATVKMEEVILNGDNSVSVIVHDEEEELIEDDDDEEDEYGVFGTDSNLPDQVIPRRSSMMNKDRSRRPARKKTVSFSSMPTEKKIATGRGLHMFARKKKAK
ncbi:phosphoinositide phospholipase c [Plakobranchus ocellatus]|uniref:Phosphoinositide phospholipase c n=1 Tax=Plakobranchus ocellatus TaxID=259542 RepID=A0AAV4E3D1_9GAST|nr:phosphoinositide phospholipase c [Plakobranchus ocellatus]